MMAVMDQMLDNALNYAARVHEAADDGTEVFKKA